MKKTKRSKKILELTGEEEKVYNVKDAIDILKKCPKVKFDETIEVSIKLGVDPKKSDQQVRGIVNLPHGSGKTEKILVFAKGDKVKEAIDAGADFAGEEYIEKVKNGWLEFTAVIAAPDMMRDVGKLGKILGPRSLMPTPKAGTVTNDVAKAVKEIKAGKLAFKVDKNANINTIVGKVSFEISKLLENFESLISAIIKAKPISSKGIYMKHLSLASTMGPGISIDLQTLNVT